MDIFDLVSGMQKEAIKEERLEKERRREIKRKKRAKEGQKEREPEKEVGQEKEKDNEEVLRSVRRNDSEFQIFTPHSLVLAFKSHLRYF